MAQPAAAPSSLIPSTVRSYQLDKLSSTNYLTWATRVTLLLKQVALWDIVSGTTPKPAADDADWLAKDLQAQSKLMLHLGDRQVQMVRCCQSSPKIWAFLRSTYHHEDLITRVTALKKLLLAVLTKHQDISKFLDDWRTLLDDALLSGLLLDDSLQAMFPLAALPTSWHPFITTQASVAFSDNDFDSLLLVAETIGEIFLDEALSGPEASSWRQAMDSKYQSLMANGTWQLVPAPPNRKLVTCKWLLRKKFHADGSVSRYKAQLVARGFTQIPGMDYSETFSPVLRITSFRVLIAIAALFGFLLHQMDVRTAFLNGDLQEEIYMSQPDGGYTSLQHPDYVCRLLKALYGLKQSPRQWYLCFHQCMISLGYTRFQSDANVYNHHSTNVLLFLAIYVDDILILSNSQYAIDKAKGELQASFSMIDMGTLHYCLGIQSFPFANILGGIRYLVTCTRPDICFATNLLSRYMKAPSLQHIQHLKRLMRYLQHTKDYGICFYATHPLPTPFLFGCSDADWGGDQETLQSTSGFVYLLARGSISWQSKKQDRVTLSSTEAEYVAMTLALKEGIWLNTC
ncbi:hypothetical protein L7F22_056043 [Adiantum nelumboides]|nr:hypothetical protein [Adiantum nelumboides]